MLIRGQKAKAIYNGRKCKVIAALNGASERGRVGVQVPGDAVVVLSAEKKDYGFNALRLYRRADVSGQQELDGHAQQKYGERPRLPNGPRGRLHRWPLYGLPNKLRIEVLVV